MGSGCLEQPGSHQFKVVLSASSLPEVGIALILLNISGYPSLRTAWRSHQAATHATGCQQPNF
jgi:hypothetical protein